MAGSLTGAEAARAAAEDDDGRWGVSPPDSRQSTGSIRSRAAAPRSGSRPRKLPPVST